MGTGQNSLKRVKNQTIRTLEANLARCQWKLDKFSDAITLYSEEGNQKMVDFAIKAYDTWDDIKFRLNVRLEAARK